jgi:carboxymethylenebutenolidase
MGDVVTIRGGLSGYLASGAGPGPAVLVLHDGYGLLPHVRERCEDLAAAGFLALAPELGEGAGVPEAEVALAYCAEQPGARADRRGAVGFSRGGALALRLAASGALDVVVAYYAALDPERAPHLLCPVLGLYAERDEVLPAEVAERFVAGARARRTTVEAVTYPGTVHSFANTDVRPPGTSLAPQRAWARTVNFLQQHLGEVSLPTR